jgi:hypothetical protein
MQSDYQALQVVNNPHLRAAILSDDSHVIVSGTIGCFPNSEACKLLHSELGLNLITPVSFLKSVDFSGVPICRGEHVMYEKSIYHVSRIVRVEHAYYMLLEMIAREIHMHASGMLWIRPADHGELRFVSLSASSPLTGIWVVKAWDTVFVVVKY